MAERMIPALVFGVLLTIGGAVLLFLAFKVGWKYMVQEKRCTAKTTGVVRKYGVSSGGISAAIVFFEVDGKTYKARSWTPLGETSKTVVTPFSQPSQTYKEEENTSEFTFTQNSFVQIKVDPTRRKHPKGTILDVWYDPKNPKLCYAERYANKKAFFWIFLLGAVIVFAVDILVMVILL